MKKIVVLGGSFNPPTKAHKIIMETSREFINADKGIYLPSDISYLERSKKDKKPEEILTNEQRTYLLKKMYGNSKNYTVEEIEYFADAKLRARGMTLISLRKLRELYPDTDIYWITGSDKLEIMSRWKTAKDLFLEFKFIIFERENDNVEKIVQNNDFLKSFSNKFITIKLLKKIESISSTKARQALRIKDYSTLQRHLYETIIEDYIKFISDNKKCIIKKKEMVI